MEARFRKEIKEKAKEYEASLYNFLRELIKIPSTSCNEKKVIERIVHEMEVLDFDEVFIDDMGNVHGRIGSGNNVVVFDGHIDTVGVGEVDNWWIDPFIGKEDDTYIYGRGASDQEGGFAAALYAAKVIKDLSLGDELTIWVVGSVQEEDCDGLCWQYILEDTSLKPDLVVLTEPTGLQVYRGHRGRMEIKVSVKGVSAHGSAPERGDNAIYKMAPILMELEGLNQRLKNDEFLGKGSLTVSEIYSSGPSRCAVADGCWISIDRRLTAGETEETALEEIRTLPSVLKAKATVEMYYYERPSYKGYKKEVPCYFPTWTVPVSHIACKAMKDSYSFIVEKDAVVDKWTFSTNGVSIMGKYGVPCIGFGPGREEEAHAPNEKIMKEELLTAVKVYATLPSMYMEVLKNERKTER